MHPRILPLAVLALATLLPAQQTTTLTAVVTDHKGTPVPNLPQANFVVRLDGNSVPLSNFQAVSTSTPNAPPVETIVVVDAINTRITNVAFERSEIQKFLRADGGHLAQPTSIVVVTDTSTTTLPTPSRDGNALAEALGKSNTGLREFRGRQGFYSWIEQFQLSSRALQQIAAYQATRPGHKLLLWVSPGWPLLSGPEVQLSKKDQRQFFAELVSLTQDLRKAHITLSSIDPLGTADAVSYRTTFYQQFTKPVPDARHMQIGNLALQSLATQSGGRVLNGNNSTALLLQQAASDAEAFYTFSIPVPKPTADNPFGFHPISTKVEAPGLTARAPTVLYTAPTPETAPRPTVPPPTRP